MSLDLYEKTKVVGKGSYGEVWLVKHKKDSKNYVLKRMDLQNASKRERKAAEQEAKLLSRLKHPNIVSYKDSFEAPDGYLYIAMGFCEGGDLYTRLKQQKGTALEERQVVEWFVQIAMALQYMHERNILHRDLKTQNIFLTKSKIIKLGDLGIARVLESSEDMASTLIGTPYYMSPELFSNKPYNHKSDVWALGCCVYEMATLKHAFNAKDMNSLVYKILRGKMPLMPKIYSAELVELIRIMLNQDPDRRPSVNRILRNHFIKRNIAIFLEGTRSRKPSLAGRPSSDGVRPGSGNRSASGNRPTSGDSRRRVSRDQPDSHDMEGSEESKSGRKSHRSKDADAVSIASVEGESTSRSAIFDNPKPVDKPRPLPPPPSSGTPVKKRSAGRRTSNGDSGISTSTSVSSSLDTQQDGETPRTRNLSARARRREKKQLEGATEGSVTPTAEAVLNSHPIHKSRSAAAQLDEADGVSHGRWERRKAEEFNSKQPHRQPSQDDGESSSDTENSQEVDKKSEMSNFISLLDTTLKMENKTDDYRSDDEFDVAEGGDARPSRVPKTNHPALHRIHSEPAVGAQTLSSSGRLMDRIAVLRKDCIRGLGIPKLHKAYEILDNIDGDELEPRLLELLGKDDFDTYAGKIWQLKFCEESAFGLK